MKRARIILSFIITVLSGGILSGQQTEYGRFPAQLSFIYPAGTSGSRSANYCYNFSLNALMGYTGSIKGCEIGGLLNINKTHISGFQVGGIGNITNGNVTGMQVGGIFGLTYSMNGFQVDGILSKSGEVNGVQISGILSFSKSANAAISGIANINNGSLRGIQIAGIYNQTKELNGIQIGLINVADTVKNGISLGLINIVKKGFYDEWTIHTSDYLNLGVSYKLGSKSFYSIYSVGTNFIKERLLVAGFGFGHISEISSEYSFQPEVICYTYFPKDFNKPVRDTYMSHFKFGFVLNLNEKLAFSFAPSIYWSIKSNRGRFSTYGYENSIIEPIYKYDVKNSNSRIEIGFGVSLGLNIR
jgi:hypothetical protein